MREEYGEVRSLDCLRVFGGGEPEGEDMACPFDSLKRL